MLRVASYESAIVPYTTPRERVSHRICMKIFLENVRSFAGAHEIPTKPLTIIVGENSSGKTTFLSMLSAMFSPESQFPSRPAFNEPPYDLGSYDTIATFKGGKYGRARRFSLGYEDPEKDEHFTASYVSRVGQPTLSQIRLSRSWGNLSLTFEGTKTAIDVNIPASENEPAIEIHSERDTVLPFVNMRSFGFLIFELMSRDPSLRERPVQEMPSRLVHFCDLRSRQTSLSVAPVRTKPRRTYDPISDEYQPEGEHIPILLSRFLAPGGTARQRDALHSALDEFGRESGLFTSVKVKKLGKSPSDPFRILVAVSGPPFNLTDVGYGVSQSLPVVVQSVLAARSRLLLLQQPEVHLHPRAQAALGSLFVQLVNSQNRRFVIETHSDFLLDRIRQEIAKGKMPPEMVSVVFFSRRRALTRVFPLRLDEKGNVIGAPATYRDFFVREETNLLLRGSE